jgi:hypothetical protein
MLWREYRDLRDRDARVSLTPLHSGSTLLSNLPPLQSKLCSLPTLRHKFLPNNVCQGFLP